jgi:hypothetical protein
VGPVVDAATPAQLVVKVEEWMAEAGKQRPS